ncbi:hypothetical protein NADFUDRAFT_83656 [Nadsonia fulvescens var. elongata DSM 6958]|uniref:Uncharacterized protein n=1 Tax=Nadsonia fulvescens var. elongata DSM 6958 TaxID=857566 RepID=A0A1E3PH88_9ASCO|nr:hypothetical protein NADFUDRAFT_83656 [Nadsonia fulvescens var. elongata DSM 6958]
MINQTRYVSQNMSLNSNSSNKKKMTKAQQAAAQQAALLQLQSQQQPQQGMGLNGLPLNMMGDNSTSPGNSLASDEIEAVSAREISIMRYVRHCEWMELVAGTAVNSDRILPPPGLISEDLSNRVNETIRNKELSKNILLSAAKYRHSASLTSLIDSCKDEINKLKQDTQELKALNGTNRDPKSSFLSEAINNLRHEFGYSSRAGVEQSVSSHKKELHNKFGLAIAEMDRVKMVAISLGLPEALKAPEISILPPVATESEMQVDNSDEAEDSTMNKSVVTDMPTRPTEIQNSNNPQGHQSNPQENQQGEQQQDQQKPSQQLSDQYQHNQHQFSNQQQLGTEQQYHQVHHQYQPENQQIHDQPQQQSQQESQPSNHTSDQDQPNNPSNQSLDHLANAALLPGSEPRSSQRDFGSHSSAPKFELPHVNTMSQPDIGVSSTESVNVLDNLDDVSNNNVGVAKETVETTAPTDPLSHDNLIPGDFNVEGLLPESDILISNTRADGMDLDVANLLSNTEHNNEMSRYQEL